MALTRSMKFILVTKLVIRLFHPKVLLTSQNICSYRTDGLGNGKGRIYYIILSEKKLSYYNENIQHCCFKKLRCDIKRKLKFNGANNCIHPTYLPVGFTTLFASIHFYEKN